MYIYTRVIKKNHSTYIFIEAIPITSELPKNTKDHIISLMYLKSLKFF